MYTGQELSTRTPHEVAAATSETHKPSLLQQDATHPSTARDASNDDSRTGTSHTFSTRRKPSSTPSEEAASILLLCSSLLTLGALNWSRNFDGEATTKRTRDMAQTRSWSFQPKEQFAIADRTDCLTVGNKQAEGTLHERPDTGGNALERNASLTRLVACAFLPLPWTKPMAGTKAAGPQRVPHLLSMTFQSTTACLEPHQVANKRE